jgi:arginyl-tRNA synthetase
VLRDWATEHGGNVAALPEANLALLCAPTESALMVRLAEYPDMLANASAGLAPHDVAFYLRDVASTLHSYYAVERFLIADNPQLTRARLALLACTAQVLRNGLQVIGVSAPEKM